MTAPKFNTVQPAPKKDPGRAVVVDHEAKAAKAERANGGGEDPNAELPGKDRIYGVASRARWGTDDVASLHADSRKVEAAQGEHIPPDPQQNEGDQDGEGEGEGGEDEGGEAVDPNSLTVAELKTELDARGVEYKSNASKSALVELYESSQSE